MGGKKRYEVIGLTPLDPNTSLDRIRNKKQNKIGNNVRESRHRIHPNDLLNDHSDSEISRQSDREFSQQSEIPPRSDLEFSQQLESQNSYQLEASHQSESHSSYQLGRSHQSESQGSYQLGPSYQSEASKILEQMDYSQTLEDSKHSRHSKQPNSRDSIESDSTDYIQSPYYGRRSGHDTDISDVDDSGTRIVELPPVKRMYNMSSTESSRSLRAAKGYNNQAIPLNMGDKGKEKNKMNKTDKRRLKQTFECEMRERNPEYYRHLRELGLDAESLVSLELSPKLQQFNGIGKGKGQTKYFEKLCRKILEEIYPGYQFPSCWPEWLINPDTEHGMELDCYNSDLKLALEYNGKQHYTPDNDFHRGDFDKWLEQVRRDDVKRRICDQHGVYLITVPHNVPKELLKDFIRFYTPEEAAKRLNIK